MFLLRNIQKRSQYSHEFRGLLEMREVAGPLEDFTMRTLDRRAEEVGALNRHDLIDAPPYDQRWYIAKSGQQMR